MISLLFFSLLLSSFVFILLTVNYFSSYNRLSSLKSLVYTSFMRTYPTIFCTLGFVFAGRYVFIMSTANVPSFIVPMMLYSYVLFNALLIWIPIVSYGLTTDFKGIVSHILPYGSPIGLILLLPIVEVFSQIIRPLTLTIRFATNLSAGHIIMFMFSYFSLLSPILAPFLHIVLVVLLVMEIFIAFLQSYIFVTLLSLYLSETV